MKDLFGVKFAYIRAADSEVSGSDFHALATSKEVYRFLKLRFSSTLSAVFGIIQASLASALTCTKVALRLSAALGIVKISFPSALTCTKVLAKPK